MTRVLILCTHNSARSQMAEALTREAARRLNIHLDVHSAGTEATWVEDETEPTMAERGLRLHGHSSKTLHEVPGNGDFGAVITVCAAATEVCPVYPGRTVRRHCLFVDPSGGSLDRWRRVRDQLMVQFEAVVRALRDSEPVPASYENSPAVPAA